jgi:hypothetical protein
MSPSSVPKCQKITVLTITTVKTSKLSKCLSLTKDKMEGKYIPGYGGLVFLAKIYCGNQSKEGEGRGAFVTHELKEKILHSISQKCWREDLPNYKRRWKDNIKIYLEGTGWEILDQFIESVFIKHGEFLGQLTDY